MNTKNNRRVQYTHEKIIRAVYSFLWEEHRPLSQITVREVCERAQINRSTFYAHYRDMYDVAECAERTMAEQVKAEFSSGFSGNDFFRDGFTAMFRFFQAHREFYLIYFAESNRSHTIELLSGMFTEQQRAMRPENFGLRTENELHYAERFFQAGLASLVYHWLLNNCHETPEQLYEILYRQCGHSWPFFSPKQTEDSASASSAR